ncbi:MAG: 30S ribosomal protein S16 [Pseudomonadota bacterium]
MAVKIRLARGGAKKRPYYRIVIADERSPRDGRYIERVGSYNPMLGKTDENRVVLITDRVKYWLGEGAQPTRRVEKFLADAGLAEKKTYNNPQKAEQSEKTKMRLEEKAEKRQALEEAAAEAKAEAKAEAEAPAEEAPAEEAAAEAPAEDAPAEEEKKAE